MPNIQQQAGLTGTAITRGMNAFTLRELIKRRVPGYENSEYLSELNDVYKEVWEEIQQLSELFFSDTRILTTNTQDDTFDLIFNTRANLDKAIPRMHQIHRIRVQMPVSSGQGGSWQPASPRDPNDPAYLSRGQASPATVSNTPPYMYVVYGEGTLKWAQPFPSGTQLEVWYTYNPLDLQILGQGTVTSSGASITGTGCFFTQLVPPDLQVELPSSITPSESQIKAEIILQGLTYRVTNIASDNLLTVATVPPAFAAIAYILASVPDLPASQHRVLSTLGTRNILTTPADDDRFTAWTQISSNAIQRMKNTMDNRQRQDNPKKKRFEYGAVRRGRFGY